MRFYFVFESKEAITEEREKYIEKSITEISQKVDSEVEEIENHGNYVIIKMLVSMEVTVNNVTERILAKCTFFEEGNLITNMEKPTKEFIEKWIREEFDVDDQEGLFGWSEVD